MQSAHRHLCQDFPTKAGLDEACKVFSRLARHLKGAEGYHARAWLGITRRLQNRDEAYHILLTLHREDPQNRLVLLNLIACCIMFENFQPEVSSNLAPLQIKLTAYNGQNPDDFFAQLLQIMLYRLQNQERKHRMEVVSTLENLYLRNPEYTPTTAFLAYCLLAEHYEGGPVDYAEEALAKDKRNTFAADIAYDDLHPYWDNFAGRKPYAHLSRPVSSSDGRPLLVTSYALQDPSTLTRGV